MGSEDYKVNEANKELAEKVSKAFDEFFALIFTYFKFDRNILENLYESLDFNQHGKLLERFVWLEVAQGKPVETLVGYFNSISAYNCYLEENKIVKGSEADPLEKLKVLFKEINADSITYDFVTPYFLHVVGKK